ALNQPIENQSKLISQLQTHPNTEIITGLDGPADVIIHLAGFDPPSLSETLFHTSHLHKLLDTAISHKSRFILVIPAKKTALQETAVSLVTQFGHNFSLDYRIIELPHSLDASESVSEIIHTFLPHFKKTPALLLSSPPALKTRRQPSKLFLLPLLLLIPWVFLLIQGLALYLSTTCSLKKFQQGQIAPSARCAGVSKFLAQTLKPQVNFSLGSGYILTSLGLPPAPTLDSIIKLSESLKIASQVGDLLLARTFNSTEITTQTNRLNESLAFFLTSSQSVPRLSRLSQQVSLIRSSLLKVQPVLTDLPILLSQNQKTTVLLLLQDSTEVRPSGGFLSHFAIASLENSRLADFRFYDTSSTDSQLRGQVDPPADLSHALGESNWYLRDVNWNLDFPSVATKALWFVEKEMGATAESVVSLHLDTFVQLLKITGPVKISPSGAVISASNFYNYYLSHVSAETASPPFLSQFYPALFSKLENLSPQQYSQGLTLFINSLLNRQTFVYRADSPKTSLAYLGWDGGVAVPSCRSSLPCLVNYLYPVEANVGINKVNPFISRQSQLRFSFTSEKVESIYSLTLENTSPQPSWPNGPYKNYIRLLLPIQSQPASVTIDGKEVSFTSTPFQNKIEIGFLSTTLPKSVSQIVIRWHQPLPQYQRFHYQLDFLNQPGLFQYPVTVTVTYPSGWFASTSSVPALVSAGQLQYNLVISRINTLDIDFSKP
ncbi:MAG: DUF4012 domain-containing protein, partial [Patescibacteria group bacterium]